MGMSAEERTMQSERSEVSGRVKSQEAQTGNIPQK